MVQTKPNLLQKNIPRLMRLHSYVLAMLRLRCKLLISWHACKMLSYNVFPSEPCACVARWWRAARSRRPAAVGRPDFYFQLLQQQPYGNSGSEPRLGWVERCGAPRFLLPTAAATALWELWVWPGVLVPLRSFVQSVDAGWGERGGSESRRIQVVVLVV
jgi:hypothetical protein